MKPCGVLAVGPPGALDVACLSSTAEDNPALVPGVVHIHGRGINAADAMWYVTTHYGPFQVRDNQSPQLVGDLMQDCMGSPSPVLLNFWPAALRCRQILNNRRPSARSRVPTPVSLGNLCRSREVLTFTRRSIATGASTVTTASRGR